MSTNANASNGAGKKIQKESKELKVSKVREEEINRRIRNYTGNDATIVVADCAITAFAEKEKGTNTAPGSNVLVDNIGKINPTELENGNAVTLIAKNIETLKEKKGKKEDKGKKDSREESKEREESI